MSNKTLPTKLQRDAITKVLKEGKSPSRAMAEVGYSAGTAKNPKNLTRSKAWAELMKRNLPDSLLAKKHREGLDANRVISANITYGEADEKTNDFIEVPDHATRHKFLDTAYKLKGRYADEEKEKSVPIININFIGLFNDKRKSHNPSARGVVKVVRQDD